MSSLCKIPVFVEAGSEFTVMFFSLEEPYQDAKEARDVICPLSTVIAIARQGNPKRRY